MAFDPGVTPTPEDYGAASSLSSDSGSPFGDLSTSDILGGGAALGGLAYILGKGSPSLPGQFVQAEGMVPGLQANAGSLFAQGQDLTSAGRSLVQKGAAGELTIPQQAELQQYSTGLKNVAAQQFASMGRDITKDTSAINTTAQIDAQVNAMAQQEIRTTIETGFREIAAGQADTSQSLQYSQAAANILETAGKAQLDLDKQYSDQLTAAFGAVGKVFGAILA